MRKSFWLVLGINLGIQMVCFTAMAAKPQACSFYDCQGNLPIYGVSGGRSVSVSNFRSSYSISSCEISVLHVGPAVGLKALEIYPWMGIQNKIGLRKVANAYKFETDGETHFNITLRSHIPETASCELRNGSL